MDYYEEKRAFNIEVPHLNEFPAFGPYEISNEP